MSEKARLSESAAQCYMASEQGAVPPLHTFSNAPQAPTMLHLSPIYPTDEMAVRLAREATALDADFAEAHGTLGYERQLARLLPRSDAGVSKGGTV